MTLRFDTIMTDSIAQLSYFIGDDSAGVAAVIDPRPDCQCYRSLAQRYGMTITHIFETHNHADFMSGARELAHATGTAQIFLSQTGGTDYDFEHESITDGQVFELGSVRLTARHTPGHTPEHMSLELASESHPDQPWAVFTGDSLFVGSAGRPDLVEGEAGKTLPEQLYKTLYEYYLKLDDGVIVLPGHGSGSACGASISDRPMSSIGYEAKHNPFLQYSDPDAFIEFITSEELDTPTHYKRLKKLNTAGPTIMHGLPRCPALTLDRFDEAMSDTNVTVLDTRSKEAYGAGHIPNVLQIGNRPDLSNWAGWLLDPSKPLLLVLEDDSDLPQVLKRLVRVGITQFAGYLAGGMDVWENAGRSMNCVKQITVHAVNDRSPQGMQVLDVRSDDEFSAGHVPGARHCYLPRLSQASLDGLDKSQPLAVFCGSGYRASTATSVLEQQGYEKLHNVVGSWKAWKNCDYAIEK